MSSDTGYKITDEDRRRVDGQRLTNEIGIDSAEIDWRKRFTQFDDGDVETLDALSETFDAIADDLVEEFYGHLQQFDRTMDIIGTSTKSIEALKRTQREYLKDLGRGEFGQAYFDRRARIGKIHDMLDLGPEIYLGAYSIYYEGIFTAIAENVKARLAQTDGGVASAPNAETGEPSGSETSRGVLSAEEAVDAAIQQSLSAIKLLNLDQQVAMDTYIHSYSRQIEAELERREEVSVEVEGAIQELRNTSEDVAASSQQISDIADEQADSMEQVTSEVSDLSATVEEIASTADQVQSTSDAAEHLAEEGQESATEAIGAMETVEDASTEVADDVEKLQERVDEIDEVVEVINKIAEQTNLLALNASIEAARAGEAGEGFAVVADEVKALAEESQQQAGQIEAMVHQIQSDTGETVGSLQETNAAIDEGIGQVEQAMDNLTEIVGAVKEAAHGIEEVAEATEDQAASTEEVASMVDKALDQAKDVRDEVEQVAAANEEQSAKVNEISRSVDRLRNTDSAGDS